MIMVYFLLKLLLYEEIFIFWKEFHILIHLFMRLIVYEGGSCPQQDFFKITVETA